MSDAENDLEEASIEVEAPGSRAPMGEPGAGSPTTRSKAEPRKATDIPADTYRKARDWYRGRDTRDRLVILLGFLVIIMAIVLLAIWNTGDGFGGGNGDGTTMVPISEWDRSGLSQDAYSGNEENTNMESQNTIYPLPIQPTSGEVIFITRLTGHVDWVDESSLPAQIGGNLPYQNEPDSFQLIIRIEDALGEWQSELVYNTMGSPGSIDIDVDLEAELGGPLAVVNPQGARYLPEGYVQSVRVDFIVYTGECGDWVLDPLPVVGDGGNHYTYDWMLEYQVDSTQDDPR